jgi:hypothetical protein
MSQLNNNAKHLELMTFVGSTLLTSEGVTVFVYIG